jgi:hypothetical protein
MFLLTINDSPEFRRQYKNFKIKSVTVRNSNISNQSTRKELLIRNYEF